MSGVSLAVVGVVAQAWGWTKGGTRAVAGSMDKGWDGHGMLGRRMLGRRMLGSLAGGGDHDIGWVRGGGSWTQSVYRRLAVLLEVLLEGGWCIKSKNHEELLGEDNRQNKLLCGQMADSSDSRSRVLERQIPDSSESTTERSKNFFDGWTT